MRISRTPLRVSFVGGATDISNYYSKYGGEVVSCAIDKYVYITYSKRDDNKIVVAYSQIEITDSVEGVKHSIIREALKMVGVTTGVEIHIISDISTVGTGLGGSSAVTVGILKVLFPDKTQVEIAEMACELEINRLDKAIGKQDQYGCAIGGLKHLYFNPDGTVKVTNIIQTKLLTGSMFLFNISGKRINAEDILEKQNERFGINERYLHKIRQLCGPFIDALKNGHPDKVIMAINEYWKTKRNLSGFITNKNIDGIISKYREYGCGAKLCGAGQSGFVFIYDPNKKSNAIPVNIDNMGTTIICNL